MVRGNKFPHILFICYLWGLGNITIQVMKTVKDLSVYEEPQTGVVELVLEQPILNSSEDPTVTIPDMGWDDQFLNLIIS